MSRAEKALLFVGFIACVGVLHACNRPKLRRTDFPVSYQFPAYYLIAKRTASDIPTHSDGNISPPPLKKTTFCFDFYPPMPLRGSNQSWNYNKSTNLSIQERLKDAFPYISPLDLAL